jgi:restriction endonuclease Mrr
MPTKDPLVGALRECSLHSLLMLTSKVLTRAGWTEVELQDRRETRQKSRNGGHEISCVAHLGPTPVRMIVKVVRDEGGVRTRMLDELAGAVARSSADLGLIVTPHQVSRSVAGKQGDYGPVRVETIDGNALAALMRCSGIAVRPSGDVDYAFLAELEEVSARLLDFIRKERHE